MSGYVREHTLFNRRQRTSVFIKTFGFHYVILSSRSKRMTHNWFFVRSMNPSINTRIDHLRKICRRRMGIRSCRSEHLFYRKRTLTIQTDRLKKIHTHITYDIILITHCLQVTKCITSEAHNAWIHVFF